MMVQERLGRRKQEARAGLELARQKEIAARLAVPHFAKGELDEAAAFAKEALTKFRHCLVLGTDLRAEALVKVLGRREGGLDLRVLDSTAPDAVRAAAGGFDLQKTLFLVGSPGIETEALVRYYRSQIDDEARFVPITPLLPAALLGHDPGQLAAEAEKVAAASGASVPSQENLAVRLGAVAAGLARAGVDKLTFLLSPALKPFGAWLEQTVARSTGKGGRGVVPVDGEPPGRKDAYGTDRLFVSLALAGETHDMTSLAESGHSVVQWKLSAPGELLGEFVRWEIAAAAMAALLEVDVLSAPGDGEERTRALLENPGAAPEPSLRAQGLQLFAAPDHAQILRKASGFLGAQAAASPAGWIAAHLALADPGDYVALLAWLVRTDDVHVQLNAVQGAIRNATKLACTSGFGPRYLHSTGPLHQHGPSTGIFLQLTSDGGEDLPIPGLAWGFRALFAAQARGDFEALQARGRRILRVHVEDGDAQKIIEALHSAVKLLSK